MKDAEYIENNRKVVEEFRANEGKNRRRSATDPPDNEGGEVRTGAGVSSDGGPL